MARREKVSKNEIDDFSLDEFTFGDESFDPVGQMPKDDRSPVTKAAKGFGEGVKDAVLSPEELRKFIHRSMPSEFGTVSSFVDQSARNIRELYNTALHETKPVIKDLKRTTATVLPFMKSVTPKSVYDKLEKFTREEPSDSARQADMREGMINSSVAEIFKLQNQQKQQDDDRTDAREKIQESINQTRHLENQKQLDGSRKSLSILADYKLKIESGFQRKSLELMYRQFFTMTDLLEETKKANAENKVTLANIQKNTGLPEYAKLKSSERVGEYLRNRFITGATDSLIGGRSNFIGKVGENLTKNLKSRLGNVVYDFRSGLEQVNSLADAGNQFKELSADPTMAEAMGGKYGMGGNIVGSMVGGELADTLSKRAGKKIRGWLLKNDTAMKKVNDAKTMVTGLPNRAIEFSRNQDYDVGIKGFFKDILRDSIRDANRYDVSLYKDEINNLNDGTSWSLQSARTLNQVIPRYLAMQLRELQIIRTGDTGIGLTVYDQVKGEFSTEAKSNESAFKQIIRQDRVKYAKEKQDDFINKLTEESDFSDDEKKALSSFLLQYNIEGRHASKKNLADDSFYWGSREGSKYASKFSEFFRNRFSKENDVRGQHFADFTEAYTSMGDGVEDRRKEIQSLVNIGYGPFLKEIGIISKDGKKIDLDRFHKYALSGELPDFGSEAGLASGPVGKMRKRRGGGRVSEKPIINRVSNAIPTAPSVQLDTEGLTKAIKEAVTVESSKSDIEIIRDNVISINEEISKGLVTFNAGNIEADQKNFFNRSIGRVASDSVRGIGKGIGWVKNKMTAAGGMAWGAMSGGYKKAKDIATPIGGAIKKWWDEGDLYFKNEIIPRMTAAKLKAGKYRDAITNEIITDWKTIKNKIIDEETGKIVFDPEELRNCVIKSRFGKKALSAFVSASSAVKKAAGWGITKAKSIYGLAFGVGKKAYDIAKKWLDEPYDVYVAGDPQPRLLAIMFESGHYYSKKSNKIIKHPKEIDGPIINNEGKMLITEEDLRKGLYDAKGHEVQFGAFASVKRGLNRVKKIFTGIKNSVVDTATKGIGWFKDFFGFKSPLVITSSKMVDILVNIHDMLNERLPGRKVHGDTDGDGIRNGSYADILRKKKEAAAEKRASLMDKVKDGAAGGKAGILGMLGKLFKNKNEEENKDGSGINVDLGGGGPGGRVRKGRFGRWADKLGARGGWRGMAGRGLGRAAAAGRGLLGAGGTIGRAVLGDGVGAALGSVGGALLRGGLAVGGTVLSGTASAAAGLGSLALGAAGAVGSGILSVLSAPFVLPALAVAAAGVGAYYGYKALTKNSTGEFGLLRYVQYGFDANNTDFVHVVKDIESKLEDAYIFNGKDSSIDSRKVDIKGIIDAAGVDSKDETQKATFLQWYGTRFYPIFMMSKTLLNTVKANAKLDDADGLSDEDKKKYVDGLATISPSLFSYRGSPFEGLSSLPSGPDEVKAYFDTIKEKYAKVKGKDDKKDAGSDSASGKVGAAAVGTAALAASALESEKDRIKGTNAGTEGVPSFDSRSPYSQVGDAGIMVGTGNYTMYSGTALPNIGTFNGKVDALAAIRFKTYGLKEMEADKVRALASLEDYVFGNLKFDPNGVAQWEGNPDAAFKTCSGFFQVDQSDDKAAGYWKTWFTNRFLPAALNYASGVKAQTGQQDPRKVGTMLSPKQALDIAQLIYSTNGVWTVSYSPWLGYSLNLDPKSIEVNLQGLRDAAKNVLLNEEKSMSVSKLSDADKEQAVNISGGSAGTKEAKESEKNLKDMNSGINAPSNWEKLKSGVADAAAGAWGGITRAWDYVTGKSDQSGGYSGGVVASHPGKGTGGDINSLPMPKGKGSWDSMKDLIVAASQMVGVDPKMMAVMAAIESGFDPGAKAGTSSATGLYQFIKSTWTEMLRKYGSKYGIAPNTPPTDPRANALMGAEFLKENANSIRSVKPNITDTDLYLAHFLGAGGAKQFFKADQNNIAANVMPKAAAANKSIFYENGRPRSFAEVYQDINGRVRRKAKQFKIDFADGSQSIVPSSTSSTGSAPTAAGGSSSNTPNPVSADRAAGGGGSNIPSIPVARQSATPGAPDTSVTQSTPGVASVDTVTDANDMRNASPEALAARKAIISQRLQQSTNNDGTTKSFDAMSQAMVDNNSIAKEQLSVMKSILSVLSNGSSNTSSSSATPASANTNARSDSLANRRISSNMPDLPISTSR